MSLRILLATLALLIATPAAAYEPDHFYVIRSKFDGRVLTAEGNPTTLRGQAHVPTGVAMRTPDNSPAQLWYVERASGVYGAMGMVYIRNFLGGRVLDVEGWQTNVITYAKKAAPEWNQLWRIDGNRILSYRATNHWQCLDVLYANWRYGPNTGRWNCHGGTNQQWEWVRKERIVRMGDVPGRITAAPAAGGLSFARPLTPEEASAGGIYSWPFPGDARYKSYVLLTWTNAKAACERLVVNGTPNWRLPSQNEFIALLNTYKPWGAKPGAALEWLGWINATHWTSHTFDNHWYGAIVPNNPTEVFKWVDHPFLAACVR